MAVGDNSGDVSVIFWVALHPSNTLLLLWLLCVAGCVTSQQHVVGCLTSQQHVVVGCLTSQQHVC